MKFNKKIVIPMLAVLALGAVGVGATYALFTSDAKTDVAIQAGKVKYAQTVEGLTTFSGVDMVGDPAVDVLQPTAVNGKFTNGGTASVEGGVVTLTNMTPGDKVTFALKINNSSNVSTKFRTLREIVSDNGLFDGLKVTIDSNDWDGTSEYTNWENKDAVSSESLVKTVNVSIELPSDKGNDYQEKICSVKFSLEAVQGNAYTVNPISVYNGTNLVSDYGNLATAMEACKNHAYTLKLNQDITLRNWNGVNAWNGAYNGFVFDGQGHSIKNMNVTGTDEAGFFVAVASAFTIKDVVFDGANVTTTQVKYAYAGVVASKTYTALTLDNIVIKNSRINNTWQCGGVVGFGEYVNQTFTNIEVKDCFFGGVNATAGVIFGLGTSNINVKDCKGINVQLYTDSLTWNSTAKQVGNFAVGHLYTYTLTTNNYVEDNVSVYVADGFSYKDGAYEISNVNGMCAFASYVEDGTNLFSGDTVKLVADLDMDEVEWNPIGEVGYAGPEHGNKHVFSGTFDGQNHVIENLTTFDKDSAGLFASLGGVVKNLTIKNSVIRSNHYVGGIVGWIDCSPSVYVQNCKVWNCQIKTTAHLVDGSSTEYDDGDKAGGIVGYIASGANITGCTVLGCHITGYRDVGGIVGYSASGVVSNNNIDGSFLINDRDHNYKGYTTDAEYDVHEIVGENAGATLSNNTYTNVSISVK